MQLLTSRTYAVIDPDTLTEYLGQDYLFKTSDCFVLYMASNGDGHSIDRVIRLNARDALIWLNESVEAGMFWDLASPVLPTNPGPH